jgi:hypothetical protein
VSGHLRIPTPVASFTTLGLRPLTYKMRTLDPVISEVPSGSKTGIPKKNSGFQTQRNSLVTFYSLVGTRDQYVFIWPNLTIRSSWPKTDQCAPHSF